MILPKLLVAASLMAATSTSISAMKWEKRVLLIGAPVANDLSLIEQRRVGPPSRDDAAERDLAIIEVIGDRVAGASDAATTLRERYGLSATGFTVVLIGKDGGGKLREARPIPAAVLERTIDAMPMRRSGEG